MHLLLNFLVVVATVLGSWMAFPQARRIARTRRVEGVSATWIGVSLAINAWWLTYGLVAGVWALVPVSIISLLLYGVMAWFFVLSVGRAAVPGLALGVFGLGMVPLPFLLIGGWELAGVAVGLSYGVQLLPAVVASLRTSALSGVSSTTWIIASLEALLWLAYGLGVGDAALTLAGLVGVVMASVILVRLAVTGHRPFVVLDPRRRLEVAAAG
ncbi:MAG TPA: hypothetical protein VMW33_15290 [Ilumatobacteraceae bacterium]|jgi:uncharacterized protein with PQ loop repeat|nr:hypothetical protein [Ilumatobacteraceae bacterium]